MPTQSEYALEQALIDQLQDMEYSLVRIENDADMRANFKRQLELHNQGVSLTPAEFERATTLIYGSHKFTIELGNRLRCFIFRFSEPHPYSDRFLVVLKTE